MLKQVIRRFYILSLRNSKATEAATRGVLQKKLFIKILQYSQQKSCVVV